MECAADINVHSKYGVISKEIASADNKRIVKTCPIPMTCEEAEGSSIYVDLNEKKYTVDIYIGTTKPKPKDMFYSGSIRYYINGSGDSMTLHLLFDNCDVSKFFDDRILALSSKVFASQCRNKPASQSLQSQITKVSSLYYDPLYRMNIGDEHGIGNINLSLNWKNRDQLAQITNLRQLQDDFHAGDKMPVAVYGSDTVITQNCI